MKVSNLVPGMLLEPVQGYSWLEVPWTGSSGEFLGNYLKAVLSRAHTDHLELRSESVLYLGTIDGTVSQATPGKQVVLAFVLHEFVDLTCFRKITRPSAF